MPIVVFWIESAGEPAHRRPAWKRAVEAYRARVEAGQVVVRR